MTVPLWKAWMFAGLLSAGILGWTAAPLRAGAWAQQKGKGIAIMQYYFYGTNTQFTDGWHLEDMPDDGSFVKNEWNLYVEYGLLDRVTLIGSFFLDSLVYENRYGRDTNFGLANQEVGVRWQFAGAPPQSLQLLVSIPGPYSVTDTPALGNGQTDVELAYYLGGSFQWFGVDGFYDAGLGFRLRTGPPADEARWYLTVGWKLSRKWELLAEGQGIHGLGNGTPQYVGDNILLTTDFALIKAGVSVLFRPFDGWALQAGPYAQVAGRATGGGGGFKVAVWREF